MSTKTQTVTRGDKEKSSLDLQVYIQGGQTFFSFFCPLHSHSLDQMSNCYAECLSASAYNISPPVETHIVVPLLLGSLPTLDYQRCGGFCFHSSATYTKFHPEHLLAWLVWHRSTCVCIPVRVTSSSPSISPLFHFLRFSLFLFLGQPSLQLHVFSNLPCIFKLSWYSQPLGFQDSFKLSHLSSAAFPIISGSRFAWSTHNFFLSKIYFLNSEMLYQNQWFL